MTLIKTSLLNAIAVAVKMLTMLVINKVLAIYVGPTGYAAIGQFQNAVQVVTTFASGAVNTGVTKYTAEHYEDKAYQVRLWKTAGTIAAVCSSTLSIFIFLYRVELAKWILQDEQLSDVFIWLSLGLILFVMNSLLLAILNGRKETNIYVCCNIAGSFFALIFTVGLVGLLGLYGALIGLSVYQALSFFVTAFFICRTNWFRVHYLIGKIDTDIAKKLGGYVIMAFTSVAFLPVSNILVRNHLGAVVSWEAAGYWEAMCRLSAAYLMFITTTLSLYYLPRLAELKNLKEIKSEIFYVYKLVLPVAALLCVLIYLARDLIIEILFSKNFSPMRDLFALQMVGDILKVGSWILAYLMLAKAMTKIFIVTEIFFSIMFYVLSVIFIDSLGLEGVVYAYVMNYLIYWALVAFFVFKQLSGLNYE